MPPEESVPSEVDSATPTPESADPAPGDAPATDKPAAGSAAPRATVDRRRILEQVGVVAVLGAVAAWRFWPRSSHSYIPPLSTGKFDHGYSQWAKVLTAYTKDGRVNYTRLQQNRAELNAFLRIASGVQGPEWVKWSTPQRQAFLINLHNASVVSFVLDNYPVSRFKDCGPWWRSADREPVVRLFSRRLSLHEVADDLLLKNFPDPRIPAALCLAGDRGGPLRSEPYTASKLDAQLTAQQKAFESAPPAGMLNDWK